MKAEASKQQMQLLPAAAAQLMPALGGTPAQSVKPDAPELPGLCALQNDVQPVGHDYVEEVRQSAGPPKRRWGGGGVDMKLRVTE